MCRRRARNRLNNWGNKIPEKRFRHNRGSQRLEYRPLQTRSLNNLRDFRSTAKQERSVWSLKPTAPATRHEVPSGISSQSLLTPIGAWPVLVKQRVTTKGGRYPLPRKVTPSFSLTLGGVLRLSPAARSGPVVQPTTQVPLIVEFVHSGAPSLPF